MKKFNAYTLKKTIKTIIMSFILFPTVYGNYNTETLKPSYFPWITFKSIDIVSIEDVIKNKQYKNCEDRYKVLNNIGVTFSGNTDLTDAIRNYNKSLELFPNNIYVLFNRANAYLRQGENELAIDDYLSLMGDERIDQNIVKLHLARAYEQQGLIETAINLYRNVQLVEAAYNASILLRDQQRLDEAIFEAERALELKKRGADAQFNYAILLYLNNELDKAIAYLKKSMKNDQQYKLKLNELANYCLMNGDLKQAKKTFEKLTERKASNPYYKDGLIGLSRVDLLNNDYYECIERLKKLLKRDPNHALANKVIADAYLNMEDFKNADNHFRVAMNNGLYDQAVIGLAVSSYKQGFYQQAKDYYGSLDLSEKQEYSYDTYLTIALNEHELGYSDNTVTYIMHAIKKDPNRPEAYGCLAKIQYDHFQIYKAMDNYKRAIRLADDKKVYRVNLANCYTQLDRYKKALKVFRQAIMDDPEYSTAHSGMAMCLLMMNRHEEALAAVEKALETGPEEPFNYMNKAYILSSYALETVDDSLKSIILYQAIENINIAIQLDTTRARAYYDNNLALVYLELEEYDLAEKLFSNQVDRVSLNNIGVLYKRKGETENAKEKFQESIIASPHYSEPRYNINRIDGKRTWNSFVNRKNPIDDWTTYWIFLTNDMLKLKKHQFATIKYIPALTEELPIELKYYAFKENKKKKELEVEELDLEAEGLYKGKENDNTCPAFL